MATDYYNGKVSLEIINIQGTTNYELALISNEIAVEFKTSEAGKPVKEIKVILETAIATTLTLRNDLPTLSPIELTMMSSTPIGTIQDQHYDSEEKDESSLVPVAVGLEQNANDSAIIVQGGGK